MSFYKGFIASVSAILLSACTSIGFWAVNSPLIIGSGYSVETAKYGDKDIERLDIYRPDFKSKKKGVVVFIHGGRWSEGTKNNYKFVGAYFAKQGYITILPDFRKYPEVKFPDFVDDAAKAIAWSYNNIDEAKTHNIHLSGHSSGAHVGSLIVSNEQYLGQYGLKPRDIILDFAGIAGPYAFTPDEPDLIDMFGPPTRYPLMQATTFIDGNEPPMLLLTGGKDDIVGAFNHEKLAQAINDKKGSVTTKSYDLDHIGLISTFSKLGPKSSLPQDIIEFFDSHTR